MLIDYHSCGRGFFCQTSKDSTITDVQGSYSINFNFEDLHFYSMSIKPSFPYYVDESETYLNSSEYIPIEKGKTNRINFSIWRPVILKVKLNWENLDYPPLTIDTGTADESLSYYNLPKASVQGSEGDTLIYLHARPYSDMYIRFTYSSQAENIYKSYVDYFFTTSQDTIELNYSLKPREF